MGTVLEDLPLLSGNLSTAASSMLTVTPSCSTSLPPANSLTKAKGGSTALLVLALYSQMWAIKLSFVHDLNHLMVITSVTHMQMRVVTVSD